VTVASTGEARAKTNRAERDEAYDRYVSTHVAAIRSQAPGALERDARVWSDYFGSLLPEDRSARIADIGCGSGGFLYFLKSRGYANACGVDCSPEQIELAKKYGIGDVIEGDATSFLSSNLAAFDCVATFDVLEHVDRGETLPFLRALLAALRPGGRLILRTANAAGPFGGHIRYADFTHLQAFTLSSISQVLRLAGFERIEVLPEGPRVHGLVSAARWTLWEGINAALRFYLAVETGQTRREIFTRNLIAVAQRPPADW
jgi:2-polyprenyl-3-methyl-5-hydroxy-6-metoxy-1,4-benzoquinol methylase